MLVNGVFKGGGAKGVVYAGALRAAHAHGLRFASVAGSSAGAITATLVACDLDPDDFDRVAADAMGRVKRRFIRGLIPFTSSSVFDVSGLASWLENILRSRVPLVASSRDHVSFVDLYRATGIELNVVATDLHSVSQSCSISRRRRTARSRLQCWRLAQFRW